MRQNERNIQFNVDAYTAKLIGRENVSKLEGAVLEIVKNAYDADAKVFCMYYSDAHKCIYVIDNGIGMKEEVLKNHWMTIGNSSKKENYKTVSNRTQTGAKGIGRFALDRIADRCEMLTISDEGGLEWHVNWSDFDGKKNLSDVNAKLYDTDESLKEFACIDSWKNYELASVVRKLELDNTGTVFKLYGLHDEWNEKTVKKIKNHLENLLPPDVVNDFEIYFFDDSTITDDAKIISANIDAFDYKIDFRVEADRIYVYILRNEFDFGEDKDRILHDAKFDKEEIPYFFGKKKELIFSFNELGENGNVIGNYNGELYFNKISSTKTDTKKFYYKDIKDRKNFTKEFGGIKLYRDHFRVRPYGEYGDKDFDWLELSARRNRSPAALSHPMGQWRVGSEQMMGIINITRDNCNLEDAANRNGIQEGVGFEQLKRVIIKIITEFERDRQSVGRKLAQYKKEHDKLQMEHGGIQKFLEQYVHLTQEIRNNEYKTIDIELVPRELLIDDNKEVAKLIDTVTEEREQEIQELRDEIKMLQTLATTGIVTNMFMHEIRTLTNNIGLELDSAYEAIKYDKSLDDAFENVMQAITLKKHFASWFKVTIESVRKDKRKRRVCNIKDMLSDYIETWQTLLKRDGIELNWTCDEINFKCFPFDIENVISNLISNSIASFERETDKVLDSKKIDIIISKEQDGFILLYEDTGWGLTAKYKNRPEIITEAFESDKGGTDNEEGEDGTGMGMWIVKNTALEYDGEIDLSENKKLEIGFKTKISFGGKYV